MADAPLHTRRWEACTAATPALPPDEIERYLQQLPNWTLADDGRSLFRELRLAGFSAAIELVNRVAVVAEEEQHHPDILVHGYRRVRLELSTHAIGALSDNDFILAAKIDQLT